MVRTIYWPQWWYARWLPAKVQSGPFKGMFYPRRSTGSVLLPKLLGTYELELHPFLEAIAAGQYEQFIDLGAGEGYYAVGLCFRFPGAAMLAFESTAAGRKNILALACKNGVQKRLNILGKCEPADLSTALKKTSRTLVIVDVEGYENLLLDPEAVPGLLDVDFLVEMHPEQVGNIVEILTGRFAESHELQVVPQQKTRPIPATVELPAYLARRSAYLTDEFRGPQSWLIGKTRAKARH